MVEAQKRLIANTLETSTNTPPSEYLMVQVELSVVQELLAWGLVLQN